MRQNVSHLLAIALLAWTNIHACKTDSSAQTTSSTSFDEWEAAQDATLWTWPYGGELSWDVIANARRERLNQYLLLNPRPLYAFTAEPIAYNGVPAIILALLPTVIPELWDPVTVKRRTGFTM